MNAEDKALGIYASGLMQGYRAREDRLCADNARLREALAAMLDCQPLIEECAPDYQEYAYRVRNAARAALKGGS